jgi:hypothetical protein
MDGVHIEVQSDPIRLLFWGEYIKITVMSYYRLCGLVVKLPGYRFRGPGSIPGATRFFLRSSGSGTGSTQPRDDNWGAISRK